MSLFLKIEREINVHRHGSRLTNFAGIITQGLRIAPPEAPVVSLEKRIDKHLFKMMDKSSRLVICSVKVYILLI